MFSPWFLCNALSISVLLISLFPLFSLRQSRSPRHSQSTQSGLAEQASKLSFASAENLESMSEADLPMGFSRSSRFRQSLPLSRSASQSKLRSPGKDTHTHIHTHPCLTHLCTQLQGHPCQHTPVQTSLLTSAHSSGSLSTSATPIRCLPVESRLP